jgi:hypothetical protein
MLVWLQENQNIVSSYYRVRLKKGINMLLLVCFILSIPLYRGISIRILSLGQERIIASKKGTFWLTQLRKVLR